MAKVVERCGKVRDLDAKAFNFCTAEAHQDSLHFPAWVSEGLCRTASWEGPRSQLQYLLEGKAATLASTTTVEGHHDKRKLKLQTTDMESKPEQARYPGVIQTQTSQQVPGSESQILGWNNIFKSSDCHPKAASTHVVCSPSSLTFQQNEFAQSKIWEKQLRSPNSQMKLGNVKTGLQSHHYNHVSCDQKSGRVPGPIRMSALFQ